MSTKKIFSKESVYESLLNEHGDSASDNENPSIEGGADELLHAKKAKKTGRPKFTDEPTFKRSYYITESHDVAIRKCAIKNKCDFSHVIRLAIECYAKENDCWEEES